MMIQIGSNVVKNYLDYSLKILKRYNYKKLTFAYSTIFFSYIRWPKLNDKKLSRTVCSGEKLVIIYPSQ